MTWAEVEHNLDERQRMKAFKRMMLCVLLAVASQVVFTACHTAHGFGEDMENAGQSIQENTTK